MDNTPGDKLGVWRDMRLADALVVVLAIGLRLIVLSVLCPRFCKLNVVYAFIGNSYASYLLTYMRYIRSPVFHIQRAVLWVYILYM